MATHRKSPKTTNADQSTSVLLYTVDPTAPAAGRFDATNGFDEAILSARGLAVIQTSSEDLKRLLADIPAGSFSPDQIPQLSPIGPEIHAKILTAVAASNRTAPAEPPAPAFAAAPWEELRLGDVVLVRDGDNPAEGWFAARVMKIEDDQLTLRWRDYPGWPDMLRHRTEVAVLFSDKR